MRLLLTFVLISLIPSVMVSLTGVVPSPECENSDEECIDMCCGPTEYYAHEWCWEIPEVANVSWNSIWHDNGTISENIIPKTVVFVEYGECDESDNIYPTIPFCYAPYYHKMSKRYILKELYDIHCYRLGKINRFTAGLNGLVCLLVLPVCLPIMMIYTCIKASKERFTFKLVSWYFMSMVGYHLAVLAVSLVDEFPKDLLVFAKRASVVSIFFFSSTCLWLNVIGYEIWSGYKKPNPLDNSDRNRKHFIWYSIYVWGLAGTITAVGQTWNLINRGWTEILYPFFNLVTFVIVSVNICMTRCRVVHHTNEEQFKSQLVYSIMRLSLMMGIPRMLLIASEQFFDVNADLIYVVIILEPFVIFIVLVWNPKNCCIWKFGSFCWRKPLEVPNTTDVVYINTNSI